ncbi:GDP-fucose protein O-fucosyltransferase, partial [Tanacetum coccineum]
MLTATSRKLTDDEGEVIESNPVSSIFKVPLLRALSSTSRNSDVSESVLDDSYKWRSKPATNWYAARILNATLVVPKLDHKSFWKDSSTFSEIFDVELFILRLSKDVKVIKELPRKGGKIWVPYNMRVPR